MWDATPILRIYTNWRWNQLTAKNPSEEQKRQLFHLLHRARNTRFGKEHRFSKIKSVEEYQKAVPLRRWEEFWDEYWKDSFPVLRNISWPGHAPYFALTSGTSGGATKYIPITHEMVRSNSRAAADVLVHHLHHRPDSRVFGGKNFIMGGSTDLKTEVRGILSGDLSGIAVKEIPSILRSRSFPPLRVALERDWERKLGLMSEMALTENIRSISGTPGWLLLLFNRMFEKAKSKERLLKEILPDLELIVHGGVNFLPYRSRFEELLAGSHAETREVYPASEGFMAMADRGSGEGLRLMIDNGIFFEFVPTDELSRSNPVRHTVETAETHVNYAIVVSTNSGLWSYILGDTVKFLEKDPPRILITGRTSYGLSAFGEHLIGIEIEEAMTKAAHRCALRLSEYSIGAVYPKRDNDPGHHLVYVEFDGETPGNALEKRFAEHLDQALCETNADYMDHRRGGTGLGEPEVIAVAPGSFSAWMKKRGRLGGQNKVPRVINNQELFDDLKDFMRR